MKNVFFVLIILFSTTTLSAQTFFDESETIEKMNTDTLIMQNIDLLTESSLPESTRELVLRTVIDTIATPDKFKKIVLFSDHTWEYYDLGMPVINDSIIDLHWNDEKIHAYRDLVELKSLPDEIDLLLVDSLHAFYAPITGKINSHYCFRGKREHRGTDIKLEIGDPIRACFDGKVRVVMNPRQTGGYGNLIVVRHANGLETYYAHLSSVKVKTGEIVKAGEIIGLGGNTGRSTGAHLHFEIRYQGFAFDPERIINFETGEMRSANLFCLKKHYFSIYSNYKQTDVQSLAASQRIMHTIKSGDTLGGLAKKYGTTVTKLCTWNNIKSTTTLKIGRKLIVRQ